MPAVVGAVVAALTLGYTVARDDGVSRAASGQITWSQWKSSIGWGIYAGAVALGPVGVVAYEGWKNGFTQECMKHDYCKNGSVIHNDCEGDQ